jgi:GNAT superfamily N-acetyltransferase
MPYRVERIEKFHGDDLDNLCKATEDAINDGIGFNWVSPPMREVIENYWRGVLVVPERELFGGWLDGTLAGSAQLIKPSKSKETTYFAVKLEAHFVAPWARGHGMAVALLEAAEREAAAQGFSIMNICVRETQSRALQIYQEAGYIRWGVLPYFEYVNGKMLAGHHFYKKLDVPSSIE